MTSLFYTQLDDFAKAVVAITGTELHTRTRDRLERQVCLLSQDDMLCDPHTRGEILNETDLSPNSQGIAAQVKFLASVSMSPTDIVALLADDKTLSNHGRVALRAIAAQFTEEREAMFHELAPSAE